MNYLLLRGHDVCRLQFRPPGEPAPIFCDLYDKTTNTVFEAKGSVARPAFRMAIGQLADYARLVQPPPKKAILVPQEPRVVWPDGSAFTTNEGTWLD